MNQRGHFDYRCPHCGRALLFHSRAWDEIGFFVGFVYRCRHGDGFWEKSPHERQRPKEVLRHALRPPAGVNVSDPRGVFAQQQGFIVVGDPPRALQVIRLPLLRRIKCGYDDCRGISDLPPFQQTGAPRLAGLWDEGDWPTA
jgi:hypothetical protein